MLQVFKKFGMEKYDPINEPFDPNRHNAVFQVPDASKPEGTVAHVLKVNTESLLFCLSLFIAYAIVLTSICNDCCRNLQSGYTLYDRVIRPAEVGVTHGGENQEDEKEPDAWEEVSCSHKFCYGSLVRVTY